MGKEENPSTICCSVAPEESRQSRLVNITHSSRNLTATGNFSPPQCCLDLPTWLKFYVHLSAEGDSISASSPWLSPWSSAWPTGSVHHEPCLLFLLLHNHEHEVLVPPPVRKVGISPIWGRLCFLSRNGVSALLSFNGWGNKDLFFLFLFLFSSYLPSLLPRSLL